MTLEQILQEAKNLEAQSQGNQDKTQVGDGTPAEPVTIQTADGRTISGKDYQEIANKLAAEKPRVETRVEHAPPKPNEPLTWSDDEFATRFLKNPREGFQYYEQTTYGFDPRVVVPTLAAAVTQLTIKNQQQEAREFMKENKDFEKGDGSNWQAMVDLAQARGMNLNTADALTDAWTLAKAYGLVKPKNTGGDEPKRGMPHGRRGGGGDFETPQPVNALSGISDENLDALFQKNRGGIAAALGGRDRGDDE